MNGSFRIGRTNQVVGGGIGSMSQAGRGGRHDMLKTWMPMKSRSAFTRKSSTKLEIWLRSIINIR